jgi:flavin-dependent dehydrogenase
MNGKQLAAIWQGLLERPSVRQVLGKVEPEDSRSAWPIPARLPKAQLAEGPVLFVGDAATATDPLTGEGIGQALESGRLAAQAIATENPSEPAAVTYEKAARAAFELDHRLSKSLSNVLAKPALAELALRAVDSSAWSRRNFVRWMFEDYPRASLINPKRWRKGLFDTSGAWTIQN